MSSMIRKNNLLGISAALTDPKIEDIAKKPK